MFRAVLVRHHRAILSAAAALALLAGAGCGSKTYPVEGKVVWLDEKPATELAGGSVTFTSEETRSSAGGEIDAEGNFRLTTVQQNDGAPPGQYQVSVSPPEPPDGGDDRPVRRPKPVLDPRFQNHETSGIVITVEPKKNQVTIKVERAKR